MRSCAGLSISDICFLARDDSSNPSEHIGVSDSIIPHEILDERQLLLVCLLFLGARDSTVEAVSSFKLLIVLNVFRIAEGVTSVSAIGFICARLIAYVQAVKSAFAKFFLDILEGVIDGRAVSLLVEMNLDAGTKYEHVSSDTFDVGRVPFRHVD